MNEPKNKNNTTKYTTFKCDHCQDPKRRELNRPKFRPSLKKWKREDLLDEVRDAVLNKMFLINPSFNWIRAEDYASHFRAKVDMVKWCFMKLNHEGLLGQKVNSPPHDCRRGTDYMNYGSDNSWGASRYTIISRENSTSVNQGDTIWA